MKIAFSILFALFIWTIIFKLFFDDFADFIEQLKDNLRWFGLAALLETLINWSPNGGSFRFWGWLIIGVACGVLFFNLI